MSVPSSIVCLRLLINCYWRNSEVSTLIAGELAGGGVDGQVLVLHDMIGLTQDFSPRFLRRYANLQDIMNEAIQHYVDDIKSGDFPNEKEQY